MSSAPSAPEVAVVETCAMLPEHRGYVCSTWARGQRGLRTGAAFRLVNRIIDASRVLVLASGPTVHAWACGDGIDVVHYAYVPPELRQRGLARQLVTALCGGYPDRVRVTHPWPVASDRYQYVPHGLLEAAA